MFFDYYSVLFRNGGINNIDELFKRFLFGRSNGSLFEPILEQLFNLEAIDTLFSNDVILALIFGIFTQLLEVIENWFRCAD